MVDFSVVNNCSADNTVVCVDHESYSSKGQPNSFVDIQSNPELTVNKTNVSSNVDVIIIIIIIKYIYYSTFTSKAILRCCTLKTFMPKNIMKILQKISRYLSKAALY